MRACRYCGDPEVAEEFDVCRSCYYSGIHLETNMARVLDVLGLATSSPWNGEHTGGGCFWLSTFPNGDPVVDGKWQHDAPFIAVTAHSDVLSGFNDTPETCRDQWTVGTYPQGSGGDGDEYFDPVADEELPMLVRRLAATLRGAT